MQKELGVAWYFDNQVSPVSAEFKTLCASPAVFTSIDFHAMTRGLIWSLPHDHVLMTPPCPSFLPAISDFCCCLVPGQSS